MGLQTILNFMHHGSVQFRALSFPLQDKCLENNYKYYSEKTYRYFNSSYCTVFVCLSPKDTDVIQNDRVGWERTKRTIESNEFYVQMYVDESV
jgi:hypothetical protein